MAVSLTLAGIGGPTPREEGGQPSSAAGRPYLPAPAALPLIREDLALAGGPPDRGGLPTWTIYDPAMHRYVRIGWLEFEILSRWGLRCPQAIATSIAADTTLRPTAADVTAFAGFARRAGLLHGATPQATQTLLARRRARSHGTATWLLHNYLFLRLRLIDPDRFLSDMLPWVAWAFSKWFLGALAVSALAGFFLVGRCWHDYSGGLAHLASMRGVFGIVVALCASKMLHELGHGFAAKRLGCRVPAVGVAFLVMAPVLWTDVTDAWRLRRRRERLLVDAAGVLAELALASAATLAWCVLPDGDARDAALVLSGSTWVLTLLVNLNPLMRFDGYYLLSDLLDVPNLQERAFALARWRLRLLLLGVAAPAPERLPRAVGGAALAWAYATWVYRFSLFLGIALLVYHMAFKALGFLLMGVEIWFFLARPILRELMVWGRNVRSTGFNRHSTMTAVCLAALAALAVVPWQAHVHAPAVLRAARQTTLYVDQPGRLSELARDGAEIAAGGTPFRLTSAAVDHQVAAARARLRGLEEATKGQEFDADRADDINVGFDQEARAAAEVADAEAKQAALSVVAPFDGVVVDVAPDLQPGDDVPHRQVLGTLVDPRAALVEAYVEAVDIHRIDVGAAARFVPDDGGAPVTLKVSTIAPSSARALEAPELDVANGGGVRTRKDDDGQPVPEKAFYRVLLASRDGRALAVVRRERGVVSIAAERASLSARVWRNAVALALRESGF